MESVCRQALFLLLSSGMDRRSCWGTEEAPGWRSRFCFLPHHWQGGLPAGAGRGVRTGSALVAASGAAPRTTLTRCTSSVHSVHNLTAGSSFSLVCLVEPGIFRSVHSFIQTSSGGAGWLEVLALAATAEADADVAAAASGVESLSLAAQQRQQAAAPQGGPPQGYAAAAPAGSGTGFVAAAAATMPAARGPRGNGAAAARAAAAGGTVVYPRGPVEQLPEEHASRRERFAELDALQPGWTVELRSRGEGGTIDAVFFSPAGECVGAFANARRAALKASKEQQLAAA